MLKFPPELVVHKGNVFYVLYVVGGLLMTVTAGGQCVDVAVRTAQNPANLLRLSNKLIRLMGLQIQAANTKAKPNLKRLYITESLLDMCDEFGVGFCWFPASTERQTNAGSTCANCTVAKRCRIYYILICGVKTRRILTLRVGNTRSKLKTYSPSNQLRWLIRFIGEAQSRGDAIFYLLGAQTGGIKTGSHIKDATNESRTTSLTVGLSALFVVLLWMFLPHIAVCAVICLGWKVQQHVHSTPQQICRQ